MYTRLTTTGGRTYLQIVEAFRNETGAARQRVVANLGRLDRLEPKDLDPLIAGLNRALGRSENPAQPIVYEQALAHGHLLVLDRLWEDLGLGEAARRALRGVAGELEAWTLLRALVFHHLCDPAARIGLRVWLASVAMPEPPLSLEENALVRAFSALGECAQALDEEIERTLCLLDPELRVESGVDRPVGEVPITASPVPAAAVADDPATESESARDAPAQERRGPGRTALGERVRRLGAVLRQRIAIALRDGTDPPSVDDALQALAGIQRHRIHIGEHCHQGITRPTPAQSGLIERLRLGAPLGVVQAAAQMPERRRRARPTEAARFPRPPDPVPGSG